MISQAGLIENRRNFIYHVLFSCIFDSSLGKKDSLHQQEIILEKHHLELLLLEFKNGSSRAGSKASAKSSTSTVSKQMDSVTFCQTLSDIIKKEGLYQNEFLINNSCQMLFKKVLLI